MRGFLDEEVLGSLEAQESISVVSNDMWVCPFESLKLKGKLLCFERGRVMEQAATEFVESPLLVTFKTYLDALLCNLIQVYLLS